MAVSANESVGIVRAASCRIEQSGCSCGTPRARHRARDGVLTVNALPVPDLKERFRSLIPSYIRDSSGAIVVPTPTCQKLLLADR